MQTNKSQYILHYSYIAYTVQISAYHKEYQSKCIWLCIYSSATDQLSHMVRPCAESKTSAVMYTIA